MKILGINGIRSDGSENTDRMLQKLQLRGHEPIDANYRETRLFRFQTYDTGRQYSDALYIGKTYVPQDASNDCAVVAHSRGGLVVWRMLEIGYRFRALFLFRPAMNRDYILPRGQDNVFCIHNPDDRAIKYGSWLPFNDFGNAGRFGIDDSGVTNIQAPGYEKTEFLHHSDDFLAPQVSTWTDWISAMLAAIENNGTFPRPSFPSNSINIRLSTLHYS